MNTYRITLKSTIGTFTYGVRAETHERAVAYALEISTGDYSCAECGASLNPRGPSSTFGGSTLVNAIAYLGDRAEGCDDCNDAKGEAIVLLAADEDEAIIVPPVVMATNLIAS